jgi:histidine ammonia-lyase
MPTIQESQQRAAKQALSILRSCGVGPASEDQAVRQVLNAYLRSFGKRVSLPITAVRELLGKYTEQRPAVGLYDWLTRISKQ